MTRRIRFQGWLILLGAVLCTLQTKGQSITPVLEPEVVKIGAVTRYALVLRDLQIQRLPDLQPPQAPGLKLISPEPGVSQQTSIVNGRRSSQIELSWQIMPLRSGTLSIPGQTIQVNGSSFSVPDLTLQVLPETEAERTRFRFVWDLPEKEFYVGEAIPVFLKAYIRNDLRAARPEPAFNIGEGVIAKRSETPNIISEEIHGVPYTVAVWSMILSPIRPDTFALEASTRLAFEDPANPRFQNTFFGRELVRESKVLITPPTQLTAVEVPSAGRLPGFNGAIGHFEISATIDSERVKAGEPLTLDIVLEGRGNFERIAAPAIPEIDGWRTYPPRVTFEPSDPLEYSGKKSFSYLLIPADESIVQTPQIAFSAFDPLTRSYQDLTVAPMRVQVEPAPEGAVSIGFIAENRTEARPPNTWRPFRAELGSLSAGVRPVVRSAPFVALQGLLAASFAAWAFWNWRRRKFSEDDTYARRISASKAVRQHLKVAGEAADKGQAEAFYLAAQRAIQESMGRHLARKQRSSSLTLLEIDAMLTEKNASPELKADVASLFQDAEALRYAGSAQNNANSLKEPLAKLEKTIRDLP